MNGFSQWNPQPKIRSDTQSIFHFGRSDGKIEYRLQNDKTKFIPIETKVVRTKKKFSEKSLLSRLLDKPTDKRTFEQTHSRLI